MGRDDELAGGALAVRGRRAPRHAHRPRRHGQDAARHRGRGRRSSRVQGRRLLGRAGHAPRSRARHRDDRPDARRQGRPGGAHRRPRDAAPARQPRAGDRGGARALELLWRCPNLTLLVTSRELLRVQGEVEYAVPPLAEAEAVSLFCDALAARADRGRSPSSARRLDDLPLAVELAAARTKRSHARADPRAPLSAARPAQGRPRRRPSPADAESDHRVVLRAALAPRSSSSSRVSPSSPAAARWRRPRRSATPTSTRCSRWSRRACFASPTGATGCWRRSASTQRAARDGRARHERCARGHAEFILDARESQREDGVRITAPRGLRAPSRTTSARTRVGRAARTAAPSTISIGRSWPFWWYARPSRRRAYGGVEIALSHEATATSAAERRCWLPGRCSRIGRGRRWRPLGALSREESSTLARRVGRSAELDLAARSSRHAAATTRRLITTRLRELIRGGARRPLRESRRRAVRHRDEQPRSCSPCRGRSRTAMPHFEQIALAIRTDRGALSTAV